MRRAAPTARQARASPSLNGLALMANTELQLGGFWCCAPRAPQAVCIPAAGVAAVMYVSFNRRYDIPPWRMRHWRRHLMLKVCGATARAARGAVLPLASQSGAPDALDHDLSLLPPFASGARSCGSRRGRSRHGPLGRAHWFGPAEPAERDWLISGDAAAACATTG